MSAIYFTIEKLYHFTCEACGNWWSVGDFECIGITRVACPYCGSGGASEPVPHPVLEEVVASGYSKVGMYGEAV